MSEEKNLIEIRCPHKVISKKNNNTYPCNRLCIKVYKGSRGEAYCTKCKKKFLFETK